MVTTLTSYSCGPKLKTRLWDKVSKLILNYRDVSYIFSKDLCADMISRVYSIITPGLEISMVVIFEFCMKMKKNEYRVAWSAKVFVPGFIENISVQVMSPLSAKPHHRALCFKCWGCLVVNAVAQKNPKLCSSDIFCILWALIWYFWFQSVGWNAVLTINSKLIYLPVAVWTQVD